VNVLPVIVNPVARGGRTGPPRELLERLARQRACAWSGGRRARPATPPSWRPRPAGDRLPVLAVWGGDGTYNEAARGLVGSETALLALPGGTTSVLAYELGIPRDVGRALLAGLDGERRAMAVARTDRGQLFLLMLSVGPDARILTNIPPRLKLRGGKLGITVQAFVEFLRGACRGSPRPSTAPRWTPRVHRGQRALLRRSLRRHPRADPFRPGLEVVTLTRHGRAAVVRSSSPSRSAATSAWRGCGARRPTRCGWRGARTFPTSSTAILPGSSR